MSLLLEGANVIQANGFVPNAYYEEKKTDDGRWQPARQCRVCPRGAVAVAAGKDPDFMIVLDARGLTAAESDRDTYDAISDAEQRFAHYLTVEQGAEPFPTDGEVIEAWADAPGRTKPHVVGAMRAADEYAGRPA